jgi:hypothetical protein
MYNREGTQVFLCLQDRKCRQHNTTITATWSVLQHFFFLVRSRNFNLGCAILNITFAHANHAMTNPVADPAGANKLH